MLKIDITRLLTSIKNAPIITPPKMNKGTGYLFERLYRRLANGEEVRLSELDFSAFDADDLDTLNDIYHNVFEQRNHQANGIVDTIRKIPPVCKPAVYV